MPASPSATSASIGSRTSRTRAAYQLVVGELAADFPPARSEAPPRREPVPPPPNPTIGRDDDVRAIVEPDCYGHARLVTLTGPGGMGKTRLALEAARDGARPRGRCRFVSLAP